nr:PAS domain-containing protein [Sphingomonas sp. H160509]
MRDRLRDLAASESRLRLAAKASDVGTWDHDLVQQTLHWDDRCKATFGMTADTEVTEELWFAIVHGDDRERVGRAFRRAIQTDGDGVYDVEYRTIGMSDGIERWVAARGGCHFAAGEAIRFIGTIIDITERKKDRGCSDRFGGGAPCREGHDR